MQTFCTIITASYYPVAKAMYESFRRYHPDIDMHILVTDKDDLTSEKGITLVHPAEMSGSPFLAGIEKKYAHTNPDLFRWALKPLLIGSLLEKGYSKVIFADPDLFFVSQFDFIVELLDDHAILLTPHWADLDIINSEDSVLSVLRNGLFNAGFIAASQQGLPAINWWAAMCHYKMERKPELGIYDDQKYLDLLPVQFENVHILRHQGCNLASWNIQTCKREMVGDRVFINRKYEPVFIHFAKDTIVNILNRNDALLKPYLDEYVQLLSKNGFDLLKNLDNFSPARYETDLYRLKHKTRLRTRFKRFLFKLAEKL